MPPKVAVFLVRCVNLIQGKFHEKEMSKTELNNVRECKHVQILSEQFLGYKYLKIKK